MFQVHLKDNKAKPVRDNKRLRIKENYESSYLEETTKQKTETCFSIKVFIKTSWRQSAHSFWSKSGFICSQYELQHHRHDFTVNMKLQQQSQLPHLA